MADAAKVIRGLEFCLKVACQASSGEKCPYIGSECADGCIYEMQSDALKLLKEHGHGETFVVIDSKTGKEADTYNIALHEDWAKNLCYCDIEGWAITDDGTLLLVDECGRFAYADRERFKVVWDD